MDLGFIFLYIFLAVLQIYILIAIGIISFMKKMYTPKSIRMISELSINFFLPFYACIELAKTASWDNVEIMWILIVSVLFSIFTGFVIGIIFHKIFKLDERIKFSFIFINAIPGLGTLPFVIGKAMCSPGGMLEGDYNCKNILGFMMMNYLIFQIVLFVLGFPIASKEKALSEVTNERLTYLWAAMVSKRIIEKDYAVIDLFDKFAKKENLSKKKFEIFCEENKLECLDYENYKYVDKKIINKAVIEHVILNTEQHLMDLENKNEQEKEEIEVNLEAKNEDVIVVSEVDEVSTSVKEIKIYYTKIFSFIEENLNTKLQKEYESEKNIIIKNLESNLPIFPVRVNIQIDQNRLNLIDMEWNELISSDERSKLYIKQKKCTENHDPESKANNDVLKLVLNKMNSPAIIACFLGLLIGMSGMRNIIFSDNHYIANLLDGVYKVSNATVPFLFCALGISMITMITVNGINLTSTLLSLKYLLISFLIKFALIPIVGGVYVYLWSNYFSAVVASSKLFKMSLFFSFALPGAPIAILIAHVIKFFYQETATILFLHNLSLVITITVLYLIYYILFES